MKNGLIAAVAACTLAFAIVASTPRDAQAAEGTLKAKDPLELMLSEDPFSYEPYALMLKRGDAGFRLAANCVLARLYRSGEIAEIYRKWFGPLGDPPAVLVLM